VTLIYVLISWVNPLAPVAPALSVLLRPLLEPIRRILPTIGGIDLSPMVLLIAVYLLQMVVGRLSF
jgi:YggT family protein